MPPAAAMVPGVPTRGDRREAGRQGQFRQDSTARGTKEAAARLTKLGLPLWSGSNLVRPLAMAGVYAI
jgi:hypothetical protein